MLKIQSLASGSKGNCTHIQSPTTQVLVDAGLTLTQMLKRMAAANVDPNKINGVVITHEHSDHIFGLEHFLNRYDNAKAYLHSAVTCLFPNLDPAQIQTFDDKFKIGDIDVDFFNVPHDSKFCFGYSFQNGEAKISVATDLGRTNDEILANMAGSQIVMLESNHDLIRLAENKKYHYLLKQRIMGGRGHLSNPASADAVYKLSKMGTSQFILAHLSEENNSPSLAFETMCKFLDARGIKQGQDVFIDVATQNKPTLQYTIDA